MLNQEKIIKLFNKLDLVDKERSEIMQEIFEAIEHKLDNPKKRRNPKRKRIEFYEDYFRKLNAKKI